MEKYDGTFVHVLIDIELNELRTSEWHEEKCIEILVVCIGQKGHLITLFTFYRHLRFITNILLHQWWTRLFIKQVNSIDLT